ncbi:MAG: type III pantothenate kinase [Anaerorhabdus sp.]
MLLTIDVGNTHITMGILNGSEIIGNFRLTTKTPRTSDEYEICLSTLLERNNIIPEDIEDIIIASVVPKIMHSLVNCIRKYLNKMPIIIGPGIKTGVQIHTDNPKEVGADRIVNVAAGYYTYHKACLIIDFGTATTFDYISKSGVFCHTVIAPGLEISAQALWSQTAKLPEFEIKKPNSILAKNTIHGMQAGVVYGYIGQVEYIIKEMIKELKTDDIKVIATGGLGRIISAETELIDEYDPHLAFKGMKIIYDKNK